MAKTLCLLISMPLGDVGGLPFASEGVTNSYWAAGIGEIDYVDLSAGYSQFTLMLGPNTSTANLLAAGDNVVTLDLDVAALGATASIFATLTYRMA